MELSTPLKQIFFFKYSVDQVMNHSQQVSGIQKNARIMGLEKAVIWKPDK